MSNTDAPYVTIAKIGATYGVKGWLKVQSFSTDTEQLLDYDPWYVTNGKTWEVLAIEDRKPYGKGIIIKLSGIDTPEQAKLFNGKLLAVTRAQLPILKKNEFYWQDLIGLTVIDQHQKNLGKVSYLMETGANDVLVVSGEKEHAIPYLPDVITRVDLENQELHVNWEII